MAWRAAVIGCGRMGCGFDDDPRRTQISAHAGAYAKVPGVELVALADLDQTKLDRYGDKYGVARRYRDHRELLRAEAPDIVSVCTWNHTHADVVRAAAEAGVKAVFCEKPLADSAADAREVVEICDRLGVMLLVNHKRRFSAFHQSVAAFLRGGGLGTVQQVTVYYVSGLTNTGSHLFDLLRMYFGDVAAVHMQLSHRRSPLPDDPNVDGVLWFEQGFPVILQACDTASFYILEIIVLGTAGRLRINTGTHESVSYEAAAPSPYASEYRDLVPAPSPLPEVDARPTVMVDSITHLLDCLERRATPLCSGLDGLRSIEIIEAITASARSGRGRIELRSNSTV